MSNRVSWAETKQTVLAKGSGKQFCKSSELSLPIKLINQASQITGFECKYLFSQAVCKSCALGLKTKGQIKPLCYLVVMPLFSGGNCFKLGQAAWSENSMLPMLLDAGRNFFYNFSWA